MTKTYSKEEFNDMLTKALMNLLDQAKEKDCDNAATGIMLTGIVLLSEIRHTVFDDDTEMITIEKE